MARAEAGLGFRIKTLKIVPGVSASGAIPDIGDVERFVRDVPEADAAKGATQSSVRPCSFDLNPRA